MDRYKNIIMNSVDAIVVANATGVIEEVNPAAEKLFGYPPGGLNGQRLEILMSKADAVLHDHHMHHYIDDGKPTIIGKANQRTLQGVCRDGQVIPLEIHVSETTFEGERFFTALIRDVSLRTELEAKTQRQKANLMVLYEIANFSHASLHVRLHHALEKALQHLQLDIGIIGQVVDGSYTILEHVAPACAELQNGQVFDMGNTYCDLTMEARDVVSIAEDVLQKATHPCFKHVHLDAYIGVPISVKDTIYGTLNFSAGRARDYPLSSSDREFVRLLSIWVGTTVENAQYAEELRISEERFKRSQNFANIGTWDWNIQTGELFWSARIAPLFGYEEGELETTYENFLNAIHPDDRPGVMHAVDACVEKGENYDIEHRVVWPDGEVRWVKEQGDVVRAEDGTPLHMLGVVLDIHQRKVTEEALLQSETRLKEAQRMGKIGHWSLEGNTGRLQWSDEIYRIFGYEPGAFEPDYEQFFSMVHPEDVEKVKASERRAEKSGIHKVDHRIVLPDGSIRWVHEEAMVHLGSDGKIEAMVGTVQDISESYSMQALLKRQKKLLNMLHQSITHYVVKGNYRETMRHLLDELLVLTKSEYGICGEVAYSDDNQPYLSIQAIANSQWDRAMLKKMQRRIERGFELHSLDNLIGEVMQSGEVQIQVLSTEESESISQGVFDPPLQTLLGMPIYYGDELVGMYALANRKEGYDRALCDFLQPLNVTCGVLAHSRRTGEARENNRMALIAAKEGAVKASKAKSEFLSSMSHELRTPLNAIIGFAQLMEIDDTHPLSKEQHESVQDIIKAGNHLMELVNDVLDLARIEAGKMEFSIEPISVVELFETSYTLIKTQAERQRVVVSYDLDSCAETCIQADYTRIKQVLLNLISNAVKYNRQDGTGRVGVVCESMPGERVRISVSDNGLGIAENKLDKLFESFNRLGAEQSAVVGTGIGLVITRQLVEQMGGALTVRSVEGEGSTFSFVMPCAQKQSRREPASLSTRPPEQSVTKWQGQKKILYIEDNPVNLKLVKQLIEKHTPHALISAMEPLEGLAIAAAHSLDLILLDINLPGMDGYEVLMQLQKSEHTARIPVVAITANAMSDDLKKGEQAGFAGYLTKPLNVRNFLREIEAYLLTPLAVEG